MLTLHFQLAKKLKTVEKCDIWDMVRKLVNTGKIQSLDEVDMVLEFAGDKGALEQINRILLREYEGKKLFSLRSLLTYLERIDNFQAIDPREGLQLLLDYLMCCEKLGIEPRTDSDSLKREHDVAARMARMIKNEEEEADFNEAAEKITLMVEDDEFIARPVRDLDDLYDEANQMHNCLAGYTSWVISGKSKIFFMRRKSAPEKSYVSIEVSKGGHVRQAYERFNSPVTDAKARKFLELFSQEAFKAYGEEAIAY